MLDPPKVHRIAEDAHTAEETSSDCNLTFDGEESVVPKPSTRDQYNLFKAEHQVSQSCQLSLPYTGHSRINLINIKNVSTLKNKNKSCQTS